MYVGCKAIQFLSEMTVFCNSFKTESCVGRTLQANMPPALAHLKIDFL